MVPQGRQGRLCQGAVCNLAAIGRQSTGGPAVALGVHVREVHPPSRQGAKSRGRLFPSTPGEREN